MTQFPADLSYTTDHEWIDDAAPATIGLTEHATTELGDIVYVDLPEVGTDVSADEEFGEVESVKSVSALRSPATGTVVEVNTAVVEDPALINEDPYGAGWLIRVDVDQLGDLLSADAYQATLDA